MLTIKSNLTLLLLLFCVFVKAQDTILLNETYYAFSIPDSNTKYLVKYYDSNKSKILFTRTITEKDELLAEEYYSDYFKSERQGSSKFWNKKGQLLDSCWYEAGKQHGSRTKYWANGKLRRLEKYESGKMIEGKCFDSSGIEKECLPEFVSPEFPGGNDSLYRFIGKTFKYPEEARYNNIQGKVYVTFVVYSDGSINEIKILRGVHASLDSEATYVIEQMPNWIPGTIEGEPANFRFNLPIVCRLEGGGKSKKKKR